MGQPRRRSPLLALAVVAVAVVVLSACGAATPAAHREGHRSTAVTLRGSLVTVRGTALSVQDRAQDRSAERAVRVSFDPMATPIYAVTVAGTAALRPGSCVTATGTRDASDGMVTASDLVITTSYADQCPPGVLPPAPASAAADTITVAGQILGNGGDAVLVGVAGMADPTIVMVPAGVPIFAFAPASRTALTPATCVVIQGTSAHLGTPIAATHIVDWPPATPC